MTVTLSWAHVKGWPWSRITHGGGRVILGYCGLRGPRNDMRNENDIKTEHKKHGDQSTVCLFFDPNVPLCLYSTVAPPHIPTCGRDRLPNYPPRRNTSGFTLCRLFKTNIVYHRMGLHLDNDYLRLDLDTSKYPPSGGSCEGNIPTTGVDVLDYCCARDPPCLGAQTTIRSNDGPKCVQSKKRCVVERCKGVYS